MAYGLEIYNASGNLRLSLTDKLTRVRETFSVAVDVFSTHTLSFTPDWNKCAVYAQATGTNPYAHRVVPSGNTVIYSRGSHGATGPSFITVVQYK